MLRRLRGRVLALTARIVGGYTLAAAVILSSSAFFLYRGLEQGFVVEDTELLSDQIEQVRGLVAKGEGDLEDTRQFILGAAGVRNLEKYYGRLLDEHGAVIAETPGMDRVAPATAGFSTPISAGEELKEVIYWHDSQGIFALLGSAQIVRSGGGEPWVFQIALDADHVAEWLGEYRERLYWMIGGGTFVTALLGWFVTRRGLRPLRQITAAVKDVTAHEMHGSLDAKQWPSELAALAGEFDEMLARLRKSFEQITQFSADVAHEFRTPLNNLMGATSLALSKPRDTEDYRAALEANLEQFERLGRMVESLLFIARAENAQAVLELSSCDVAASAREVADFFSALAEDRGIALTTEGEGRVQADEVLLRLALTNLISNALRHTPHGGEVKVRVAPLGDGCEIAVSDTGVGIAEEHRARLFDRFYRVDASRAGSESGSGLGLAIVKSVLTLHGGTVSVESEPGRGTRFRIFFPAKYGARVEAVAET